MSRRVEPAATSLRVRAHPRAARDGIGPVVDGVLQVRVSRPPVDGQANDAIRRLLAVALGLAPSRLRLAAGEHSRDKRFSVDGLTDVELADRLRRLEQAR